MLGSNDHSAKIGESPHFAFALQCSVEGPHVSLICTPHVSTVGKSLQLALPCVLLNGNMFWRQARPEPRLAVVTHSSFLFFMLSTLGSGCDERIKGELHRWCAALRGPALAA